MLSTLTIFIYFHLKDFQLSSAKRNSGRIEFLLAKKQSICLKCEVKKSAFTAKTHNVKYVFTQ